MIASRAGNNRIASAESILSHELRRNVRVALFGEVAVLRASNESAIARRIEPALRLAVRDDWYGRLLLLLMVALATASAVPPIAAAVSGELLIVLASARSILTT